MTKTAPYGSWLSPISAATLTAQTVRISEPHFDGETIYWLESRPDEKGRNALVRLTADGQRRDLLSAPHSVRTRANEYGGGAYTVANGAVYMVLDADQRVYRLSANAITPEVISPEGNYRYADFCVDMHRQRLICVREDHTRENQEERSEIIALALNGLQQPEVLVTGADFYSNPRISPDGSKLSWLSWNHPQMPWDGTECYVADLDGNGKVTHKQLICGSDTESVFQPQWSPGDDLFFVSDRNNWWNLYRWNGEQIETLCEMDAEFAAPQWVFGMSTYGVLDPGNNIGEDHETDTGLLLCCFSRNGQWQLASLDVSTKKLQVIECDLTDISAITCANGRALLLGASSTASAILYLYDVRTGQLSALAHSSNTELAAQYLSRPEAINFKTSDGETAHGFYYAPRNPDYLPPPEILPPLLVMCHGGPTSATDSSLNLKIQYWTSRGFAVLDVNYRGSTGYGREYRDRLKGNWGITDVIDACSGVDHLINERRIDAGKVAIRGSSAGGYTVLAALTFSNHFKAGASLYGIGNLESLAQDTHKFESRYLDQLIGKYPEQQALYKARSPINHIGQLDCPVIFFQGLQDKVVPPNQAEAMVSALTEKGIANAYVTFAEEGHGFRQAGNIERAIEAELFFYSRIFGFAPDDNIAPVEITNLRGFLS